MKGEGRLKNGCLWDPHAYFVGKFSNKITRIYYFNSDLKNKDTVKKFPDGLISI